MAFRRRWIEARYLNWIHYSKADRREHLAAFEQSDVMVDELRVGPKTRHRLNR